MKLDAFSPAVEWIKHRPLTLVLPLGLVWGLIFVFLLPPWQHYDEPGHFERLSLTAHDKEPGDDSEVFRLELRREIAASMIEHGFFQDLDYLPNLIDSQTLAWIGFDQLGDMPLYYWLTSLPLRLAKHQDISLQLYISRIVSLGFLLGTIVLSFFMVGEISPRGSPIRWLVPLGIIGTPGFVDSMTSVNNDVAATFFFSLFLLLGLRLLVRDPKPSRLILFLAAGLLCVLSKSTVWVSGPLIAVMVLLLVYRKFEAFRPAIVLIALAGFLLIGVIGLQNGDAAFWNLSNPASVGEILTLTDSHGAPFGDKALQIAFRGGVYQPISFDRLSEVRGKKVTIGAWIWSDKPTGIKQPYIWADQNQLTNEKSDTIFIDTVPTYYSFTTVIPDNVQRLQLVLNPILESQGSHTEIYFDGITLVAGDHQPEAPLLIDDFDERIAYLDGNPVTNFIRNASVERSWVVPRKALFVDASWISGTALYRVVSGISDPLANGIIYRRAIIQLFQTYWARFGWGHIPVPSLAYKLLSVFSVIGLVGAIYGLTQRWNGEKTSWRLGIFWLALVCFLVWTQALLRTGMPNLGESAFLPSARYAYPVIIPTTLIITSGWFAIIKFLKVQRWGLFFIMLVYNVAVLVSVWRLLEFRRSLY